MTVLYIFQDDWPRNATRVAKQTHSLALAGYRVCLLAGNPRRSARRDHNGWMEIRRLPAPAPLLLRRLVNLPLFFNPVWLWCAWRTARAVRADCIVVRDLPLALAAVWVGRWLGIPVHYDMADVYPLWFRASRADHPSVFSRLLRSPTIAPWVERRVIRRAATVCVVAEESRARCVALGVPATRVVLVGNTPANVAALCAQHPVPSDVAALGTRPVVLFVGNLLSDRGLDRAIAAMRDVACELPDAALVLIGDGREGPRLMQLVRALGLVDHVYFLGWKPHGQHAPYYACARVGILPFLATEHIRITLANKLFDYMGAGLPVIASDVPPMRRILEETGAGVLVPPGDSSALARTIITLLGDERLRCTLGDNGRRAVATRYHWNVDARRLVAAIETTAPARPPSR